MGKKSDAMKQLMEKIGKSEPKKQEPKPEIKKEEVFDADVNEDGVVDEKDLEVVKKSIRKTKKDS